MKDIKKTVIKENVEYNLAEKTYFSPSDFCLSEN